MTYTNRFGRTSYAMRALARYLDENGPATTATLLENATLSNGKLLKNSKISMTARTMSSVLGRHPDFIAVSRDSKDRTTYKINPNSILLEELDRSKSRRKTRLAGRGDIVE